MEENTESLVTSVKTLLAQVDKMLAEDANRWEDYLPRARSAIAGLDRIHFFGLPERLEEQPWIIQGFQDYAYHHPDEGSIQDIAEWCRTSWLRILHDNPEDVEILLGVSL